MPTWPASLPNHLLNTFKESPPENTIRTSMDVGVDKVRRRTTASPRPISFQMILTGAQTAALDTFYITTTLSGSISFDYTHPRTGVTETVRFTSPPSYSDISGVAYRTDIQLEILP